MKRTMNILKDYKAKKIANKVYLAKKRIIEKAVKRAVDEYGETYRLLAAE